MFKKLAKSYSAVRKNKKVFLKYFQRRKDITKILCNMLKNDVRVLAILQESFKSVEKIHYGIEKIH